MEIFNEIKNIVYPVMLLVAGWMFSNRQIKKKEQREQKKEQFFEFYVPAARMMIDRLVVKPAYSKEIHADIYPELVNIINELEEKRPYALKGASDLVFCCRAEIGFPGALQAKFADLILSVIADGEQLASDLEYAYISQAESDELHNLHSRLEYREAMTLT